MGLRDKELERLKAYVKALNCKMEFKPYVRGSGAAASFSIDGSNITVYYSNKESKISIILSAIHEIGHLLDFVHSKNRKIDEKFDSALEHLEDADINNESSNKQYRKIVYDEEARGISWWDTIIKDCDVRIPKYRIEIQKNYDLWVYEYYYIHDRWPSMKQRNDKFKEFKEFFKNKKDL